MSRYQKTADRFQATIDEADDVLRRLQHIAERVEAMTCEDAENGDKIAERANPHVTAAKAHAMNARAGLAMCKAEATKAGNLIPDLTVQFGGK